MLRDAEDIIDKQLINEFEAKEKNGRVKFIDSTEIVKMLKTNETVKKVK